MFCAVVTPSLGPPCLYWALGCNFSPLTAQGWQVAMDQAADLGLKGTRSEEKGPMGPAVRVLSKADTWPEATAEVQVMDSGESNLSGVNGRSFHGPVGASVGQVYTIAVLSATSEHLKTFERVIRWSGSIPSNYTRGL